MVDPMNIDDDSSMEESKLFMAEDTKEGKQTLSDKFMEENEGIVNSSKLFSESLNKQDLKDIRDKLEQDFETSPDDFIEDNTVSHSDYDEGDSMEVEEDEVTYIKSFSNSISSSSDLQDFKGIRDTLEHDFETSLDDLIKAMEFMIESKKPQDLLSSKETQDVLVQSYKKVYKITFKSFSILMQYGSIVELSEVFSDKDVTRIKEGDGNRPVSLHKTKIKKRDRDCWHEKGRKIWMILRNHPEFFIDRYPSLAMNTTQASNNLCEKEAFCAVTSGFIRALASRLILIDFICTKNKWTPTLILFPQSESGGFSNNKHNELKNPSRKELEFGLKSFARAGRALLLSKEIQAYENLKDYDEYVYSILSLSVSCFKRLSNIENCSKPNAENFVELSQNIQSEGLDSMVLLIDAASKIKKKDISNSERDCKIGNKKNMTIEHLHELESFISTCSKLVVPKTLNKVNANVFMTRFFPALARSGYKHGNIFAKLGAYSNAKVCLEIALKSAQKYLVALNSVYIVNDVTKCERDMSSQIQEQEMMTVSKETLYVLCVIHQSLGNSAIAQQCLDKIGKCILDQRKKDEDLYLETVNKVGGIQYGENAEDMNTLRVLSTSLADSSSDLAFVGSRNKDKLDILARAQAARAKAQIAEMKERANLAYSRIMTKLKLSSVASKNEDLQLDTQLEELLNLTFKLQSENKIDGYVISFEDPFFHLTLTATKKIFIYRHSHTKFEEIQVGINNDDRSFNDPYSLLFSRYLFDVDKIFLRFMNLNLVLERLSSTLSVIRKNHEKDTKIDKDEKNEILMKTKKLEDQCSRSIAQFFDKMETLKFTSKVKEGKDKSVLLNAHHDSKTIDWLTEKFDSICARAISLYRSSGDVNYDQCCIWCNAFLTSMSKFQKEKGEGSSTAKEKVDKVQAEILAIKAHSQTMMGEFRKALQTARKSWEKSVRCLNVNNLTILFYCAIAYETNGCNIDFKTLLEFDHVVSELIKRAHIDCSINHNRVRNDVLYLFPTLSSICIEFEKQEFKPILLGLQERWINMLLQIFSADQIMSLQSNNVDKALPGNTSLFCVFRAYLSNFNLFINSYLEQDSEASSRFKILESILNLILDFLCALRDILKDSKEYHNMLKEKEDKNKCQMDSQSSFLIWEQGSVSSIVGDHYDCVWVAEKLWNLAVQMMSRSCKDPLLKWFSAQFFAQAHDFALLSEEENLCLSQGFLDRSSKEPSITNQVLIKRSCSELSSEFSAQCLLLSVANTIDYMYLISSLCEQTDSLSLKKEDCVRRSISRVSLAKAEFELNLAEDESIRKRYIEAVIIWLSLKCLVEYGDDSVCLTFLSEEQNLNVLKNETIHFHEGVKYLNCNKLEVTNKNTIPFETDVKMDIESDFVSQLFVCSKRAEMKSMVKSVMHLLQLCSHRMIEKRMNKIILDDDYSVSLGYIHKKIIKISPSVSHTTKTYEMINGLVKENKRQVYLVDDFDWFSVEAYNKGVTLFLLGDSKNAELLLAITLNFLPFCGTEVMSYGSEIRSAYRSIIENRTQKPELMTTSTAHVWRLFN